MSHLANDAPSATRNAPMQLPTELFYPICAQVTSRRDLITLAATSRFLQRPSEAVLHRSVILDSKDRGRGFIMLVKECPRLTPLVRELRLEPCLETSQIESSRYWQDMCEVLGDLSGLESLIIDDGRDAPLSWVLSTLPENRLKALRCAFILDAGLLFAVQRQNTLTELSWTGALVSVPCLVPINSPHPSVDLETQPDTPSHSDPNYTFISLIQQYLPPSALPRLKYLHSESIALARVLVPGRAISHIWVPGASFAAAASSDYVYRHITFTEEHNPSPFTNPEQVQPVHLAELRMDDLSSAERSENLCRAIRDFSLSRGPVLSLRVALDLPRHDLANVLACIAQHLPELRALGLIPTSVFDSLDDEEKLRLIGEETSASSVPYFENLHTICLWSIPSRRVVSSLEGCSELPALRTLACLHFSPAFEWLCLPVNDNDTNSPYPHCGCIEWNHEIDFEGKVVNGRRRVTAVHDPKNLLWRDV